MISRFWNWANTSPGNPESVITANMGQSQRLKFIYYLANFDLIDINLPSINNKIDHSFQDRNVCLCKIYFT